MGCALAQGHGPAEAFPCPTLRGVVRADEPFAAWAQDANHVKLLKPGLVVRGAVRASQVWAMLQGAALRWCKGLRACVRMLTLAARLLSHRLGKKPRVQA